MILSEVHDLGGVVAVVGLVGSAVVVVTLGEDENVVTTTEGVLEDSSGPQVDVGVAAGSLIGGRTIEIPNTQLTDVGDFLVNGLYSDSQTACQWSQEGEHLRWSWNGDRCHRRSKRLHTRISFGVEGEVRGIDKTHIRPGLFHPGRV